MKFFSPGELKREYPDRVLIRDDWTIIFNRASDEYCIIPFNALRTLGKGSQTGETVEESYCEHCLR